MLCQYRTVRSTRVGSQYLSSGLAYLSRLPTIGVGAGRSIRHVSTIHGVGRPEGDTAQYGKLVPDMYRASHRVTEISTKLSYISTGHRVGTAQGDRIGLSTRLARSTTDCTTSVLDIA
eukprot:2718565-Rhodomonas_salina.1